MTPAFCPKKFQHFKCTSLQFTLAASMCFTRCLYRYFLSMDKVILSMDIVILPMDKVILPMDKVILSMDRVILSIDKI